MEKKRQRAKHMAPINWHRVEIACTVILICSLCSIALYFWHNAQEICRQKQLAEQVTQSTSASTEPSEVYVSPIDFETLREQNPDAYAWITIPGTEVSGPVMQNAEETDYYLDHTFEKKSGLPGALYTRNDTPLDFSARCSVIYGHNMKNGTMFGTLKRYRDEMFFQDAANRAIQIYTPEAEMTYTIFAAVEYSDALLSAQYDFSTGEGVKQFVEALKCARGRYDRDIVVDESDHLIVLSTCVGGGRDTVRYLVVGVLQDEKND